MAKQVSANLRATMIDGGVLQLTKKKTKKSVKPGQNTHYHYNVIVRPNVWRKIKEKRKTIETIGLQITGKIIASPQIVSLAEDWVLYLTIFNETLYYGIHLYDSDKKQVVAGHGINLSGYEISHLFDFLEENSGTMPHQLELSIPQFTWEWHSNEGQILDTGLWWTTEIRCLESALHNHPGIGWKLHVKTRLARQQFDHEFLDNILLHLTAQKISSMANTSPYSFNSQTANEITDGQIDLHGVEVVNSISKVELLEVALRLVKKKQYVSAEDSVCMLETVAEYEKSPQTVSKLKSEKLFTEMLWE